MGDLVSIEGGKKKEKKKNPINWNKVFHWLKHDWSKWSDGRMVKLFISEAHKIPSGHELQQTRVCKVCNKKEVRKISC